MSSRVSLVRYGDATDALDQVIRDEQRCDPLAAVTVVVSTRRIGHSLRHLLARRASTGGKAGIANVRFVTLADLSDEFGGTTCRANGRRRLTRSALGAAARVALSGEPGVLGPVADQPSTETELVNLYEELRHYDPGVTDALAGRRTTGRDLARLFAAMRSRLEVDWYDDADAIDAAITALDSGPPGDVVGETVVVHLPERARPDECRLICALGRHCDLVVHVGVTGDPDADAPSRLVVASLEAAGLSIPAEALPADPQPTTFGESVQVTDRIEAPDAEAEVRAAVRLVIDDLESGGVPTRVALLYPSAQTYLGALATALAEANIAWNGRSPRLVAEAPAARALFGLAELAELGLARERLMAWINAAPIVGADGETLAAGAFERVSRLAGIIAGDASEWHHHLRALIDDLSRRAATFNGQSESVDGTNSRQTRTHADLRAARALDSFIDDVARACEDGIGLHSWSELEQWARRVLRQYLGWTDVVDGAREGADVRLDATLTELGCLDSLEPVASLPGFVRALSAALERTSTYEGRLSYGIAVRSLWDAVGLDLDLAVVLGGVEGELPPRARSSPLLSGEDRAALALEAATSEVATAQARHALVAVTQTARRTVCTWRLRDSGESKARVRSRFFGHDPVKLAPSPVEALASVARGDQTALGEHELVVASLCARRAARRDLRTFHLVRADMSLQAAIRVVASRLLHRFDRFDGRVAIAAGVGTGRVLSPTTLETYAICPFRYFLSSELGVEFVEEPERRTQIDPRDRGSIVHEVLEQFVAELIEAEGDTTRIDTPENLVRVAERVFARYERLGRTGAPVIWSRERRLLLALLERERADDARRRVAEKRFPVALEWSFGSGGVPPLDVPLASGHVAFRGKVDRIDQRSDGALFIVDYKTGGASSYDGLAVDPVDGGRHLQLAIYALAARALLDKTAAVSASYRFLDGDSEELSVDLDDDVAARAVDVVDVIAEAVSAGLFPFNPGEPNWRSFANCTYCDFDALCPPDRDDFWLEASEQPDLAPYVALAGEDG